MIDGITKIASVDGAPLPVGFYSSLVEIDLTKVKRIIFLAGQISLGSADDGVLLFPDDAVAQLKQAMKSVGVLLQSREMTYNNLVAVTILVADFEAVKELNAAYAEFFEGGDLPVRAMFQVGVPKAGLVEVISVAAA